MESMMKVITTFLTVLTFLTTYLLTDIFGDNLYRGLSLEKTQLHLALSNRQMMIMIHNRGSPRDKTAKMHSMTQTKMEMTSKTPDKTDRNFLVYQDSKGPSPR